MQTQVMVGSPRITLISALAESPAPALGAMKELWPEAKAVNLLDDSLARDLADAGTLTEAMLDRFSVLGRYAAAGNGVDEKAAGILFTCSAFGPAIDRVRAELSIPLVSPNEGAFDEALDLCRGRPGGGRVALLLSFAGSLHPLSDEMRAMAAKRQQSAPQIAGVIAEGALAALQAGDADAHDRAIADAASRLPAADAVIIGQFSMARAAPLVAAARAEPVLTTPHAAVRKLRRLVEDRTP